MKLDIVREVDRLKGMTVRELRGRYREVFGEDTRSGNKDFLWKRIAWRLQSIAEGGLSERVLRRAEELADDADIRIRPPADTFKSTGNSMTASYSFQSEHSQRSPMSGTILSRPYKGTIIRVMVMEKGFEYNGEVYRSLTAITKKVTGTRWNGYHFFGINKGKAKA